MPLETEVRGARPHSPAGSPKCDGDHIVVALVNNMPDAALEATESQFSQLLEAASGELSVRLRLCYLPEVARAPAARRRLEGTYWHIDEIHAEPPDALIVTGLEPIAPRLADEPYWERIGQLLRFADAKTTSSIWSCLAAHAAVQHLDGIERRRLPEKCCGIFEHSVHDHPLVAGVASPMYIPHSRWNELPLDALEASGYSILSSSPETGADAFAKTSRSLMLFFQGHPEYEETTLFKEYRRDVARFLRGQQSRYPTPPRGCLSPAAALSLESFRKRALAQGADESLLAEFPLDAMPTHVENAWRAASARLYRNWLQFIVQASARAGAVVAAV
jgi:homoserine O-succinyltransferase